MPTETTVLLLDRYLPHYDITEIHAVVIDADPDTTWQAVRRTNLFIGDPDVPAPVLPDLGRGVGTIGLGCAMIALGHA